MTEQQLQAFVDALITFAEGKVPGGPLARLALEEVRHAVNTAGIPALMSYLRGRGLVA